MLKRLSLILMVLVSINTLLRGQAVLNISPINGRSGIVSKDQLLTFQLSNQSAGSFKADLHLEIVRSDRSYLILESLQQDVKAGLSFGHQYSFIYSGPGASDFMLNNGLLAGDYTVKYLIKCNLPEGELELSQQQAFNVNPVGIHVLQPGKEAMTSTPIFCISSPVNMDMRGCILQIWDDKAEVNGLPSDERALVDLEFVDPCISYPLYAPSLVSGNKYWYSVNCLDVTGELYAFTDLIPLSIKSQSNSSKPDDFRLLHSGRNSGNYLFGHSLRFGFDNRSNYKNLDYTLVEVKNNKKVRELPSYPLKSGVNLIEINLDGIPGVKNGVEYQLVVRSESEGEFIFEFELAIDDYVK